MARTRDWRRMQKEKAFNRILNKLTSSSYYMMNFQYFEQNIKLYRQSYRVIISPGEYETRFINTIEDFRNATIHRAKLLTNTASRCSCVNCCNPRRSMFRKPKERITRQEREFNISSNEQMNLISDLF